ncbi:hypothetical protein SCHPADRAFT_924924 [Schizopora paradoxa]|uniref:Uncharacterized protein n=1 Tax=Schizopora paradoxa TaxID=27342 RepID=A0A0H2S3V1_9AGAM|nr:hypothetical protein SCHPADRAFT_924924 [Schizopora paradoxa]
MVYGIPFIFEDKKGRLHNTELRDVEDRLILRVSPAERRASDGSLTLKIHEYGTASSPKASDGPSIVLEFGPGWQLGSIWFASRSSSMQMSQWLRLSSGSTKRAAASFTCSDSQVYTWIHKPEHESEAEWACQCQTSSVAARYFLKPPSETYGNSFTVEEAFAPLIPELLASLIIMRHIQEYLKK